MKPLKGTVVSTQMDKTVVVSVETKWQHPVYKKTVKRTKKYLAHDLLGAQVNDQVTMQPVKPISKRKHFQVISINTKH